MHKINTVIKLRSKCVLQDMGCVTKSLNNKNGSNNYHHFEVVRKEDQGSICHAVE